MKVYDCFIFFNELEMLEMRLAELYDYVDYFVIVEARRTFNDEPKPLHYWENRARFKRWARKIIHVVVDLPHLNALDRALISISRVGPLYKFTLPSLGNGRWKLEHALRNGIMRGLEGASPSDMVMVSDVDEIPRPAAIRRAVRLAKDGRPVWFVQRMSFYYLNGISDLRWIGTKLCTLECLRMRFRGRPQYFRIPYIEENLTRFFGKKADAHVIEGAGWHFTYVGGVQRVITKKKTGSHPEVSRRDDIAKALVRRDIEEGVFRHDKTVVKVRYVPLDKSFPAVVLKNRRKYALMIKDA